jgi:hypothetical protein
MRPGRASRIDSTARNTIVSRGFSGSSLGRAAGWSWERSTGNSSVRGGFTSAVDSDRGQGSLCLLLSKMPFSTGLATFSSLRRIHFRVLFGKLQRGVGLRPLSSREDRARPISAVVPVGPNTLLGCLLGPSANCDG